MGLMGEKGEYKKDKKMEGNDQMEKEECLLLLIEKTERLHER